MLPILVMMGQVGQQSGCLFWYSRRRVRMVVPFVRVGVLWVSGLLGQIPGEGDGVVESVVVV